MTPGTTSKIKTQRTAHGWYSWVEVEFLQHKLGSERSTMNLHGFEHPNELPTEETFNKLFASARKWGDLLNLSCFPKEWVAERNYIDFLKLSEKAANAEEQMKVAELAQKIEAKYQLELDRLRDWLRAGDNVRAQGFANRVYTLSKNFKFTEREILLHLTECIEE